MDEPLLKLARSLINGQVIEQQDVWQKLHFKVRTWHGGRESMLAGVVALCVCTGGNAVYETEGGKHACLLACVLWNLIKYHTHPPT